jgi:hypothetical protein
LNPYFAVAPSYGGAGLPALTVHGDIGLAVCLRSRALRVPYLAGEATLAFSREISKFE